MFSAVYIITDNLFWFVFVALVRPSALYRTLASHWCHIDAGGHSPVRSPPPAPVPLPPPHQPWRWAVTLLLRAWTLKLTVRPAVLQTPWPLWQLRTWAARPQMAWGMAGLRRRCLKIRGAVCCGHTWLGGSYHFRREARTCHRVLAEATHRFHLAWFADPLWSPNAYPSQILR